MAPTRDHALVDSRSPGQNHAIAGHLGPREHLSQRADELSRWPRPARVLLPSSSLPCPHLDHVAAVEQVDVELLLNPGQSPRSVPLEDDRSARLEIHQLQNRATSVTTGAGEARAAEAGTGCDANLEQGL